MATRALQELTYKLDTWVAERVLIFSPSKPVNIVFRKRRKRNEEPIKNQTMSLQGKTQFLGKVARRSIDSKKNCTHLIFRSKIDYGC